ncbi:hypothetical protein M2651_11690 [Clostridium sp. SYSU_GA19001]|uniref:hypothetical protein n=1 Tax=Clostridium caldaquaticum TaxID=2940653 RepID=UPI0020777857|nr:hypothetical protein [Clostridium caldaquaticum]MCM8711678.1 hypothetical protein [Clostridium caldaquaticum]
MKKKSVISALVLTMAIGMGATAYAASADTTSAGTTGQRLGLGRITSMRGYEYITNILKSKLGLSDAEITNSTNSGKTLYNLAIEKGMTQEQLKTALLEERTKAIDEVVVKGTITKEEGEKLKENLKTNMQNCTGNFGQGRLQGRGQTGKGQGRGCLAVQNSGTVE